MQFNELIIAIVGVSATSSVLKSYIQYKQRAAETRAEKAAHPDTAVLAELNDLKQRVTELRDVTTQYDMSFDSALHRVESRLSNVEQRLGTVEEQAASVTIGR